MKKIFAGIGIVLAVLLLTWGAPLMFPTAEATTSVEYNSGTLATGTATATAATINVSIGWTPRSVLITNVTGTNLTQAYWMTGMAAASCFKLVSASTNTYVPSAMVVSLPTVSCISTYAGSTTAGKGFTLGADTDVNVSGDTLRWEARR